MEKTIADCFKIRNKVGLEAIHLPETRPGSDIRVRQAGKMDIDRLCTYPMDLDLHGHFQVTVHQAYHFFPFRHPHGCGIQVRDILQRQAKVRMVR